MDRQYRFVEDRVTETSKVCWKVRGEGVVEGNRPRPSRPIISVEVLFEGLIVTGLPLTDLIRFNIFIKISL